MTVDPGLSFTCGFLSSRPSQGIDSEKIGGDGNWTGEANVGANRSGSKLEARGTDKGELFPGANDQLVVCTSMGIVSLHGFDLLDGTSQLEHQEFLFEQIE